MGCSSLASQAIRAVVAQLASQSRVVSLYGMMRCDAREVVGVDRSPVRLGLTGNRPGRCHTFPKVGGATGPTPLFPGRIKCNAKHYDQASTPYTVFLKLHSPMALRFCYFVR